MSSHPLKVSRWLTRRSDGKPRIYLLFTRSLCPPGRAPLEQLARALEGEPDAVQIREKGIAASEAIDLVGAARQLIEGSPCALVFNDRVDLALACGADGVHLGQDDLPPQVARELACTDGHPTFLVGRSTHDVHQARSSGSDGCVDYLGVGPVFPTSTRGYARGIGPEQAAAMQAVAARPCFWIGGITPANRSALGVAFGLAASSAVLGAEDPAAVVRALRG